MKPFQTKFLSFLTKSPNLILTTKKHIYIYIYIFLLQNIHFHLNKIIGNFDIN